jgi:hypothetical protein
LITSGGSRGSSATGFVGADGAVVITEYLKGAA